MYNKDKLFNTNIIHSTGRAEINMALQINDGKQEIVGQQGRQYSCYAVKTKVVTKEDPITEVVQEFAKPHIQPGDILFISEKMVACSQGRYVKMSDIHPGFWAKLLCKFVRPTKAGRGLADPEPMQCAIDEAGLPRILAAAVAGMVGKLFRKKGWFYIVAGRGVAAIDPPWDFTIPPFNEAVILGPLEPDKVAGEVCAILGGNTVLVVDINDLGGEILGCSDPAADKEYLVSLLKQNPLGQKSQSTPMGILRPVPSA